MNDEARRKTGRGRLVAARVFPGLGLVAFLAGCGFFSGGAGGAPIEIDAGALRMTAVFTPDPPQPGKNVLELAIRDEDGAPVDGAEIEATGTMAAMATMPEMRAPGEVEALGGGRYRLTFELAMAGAWPVSLHVHAPDGREADVELDLKTGIPVRVASAAAGGADPGISHYTCSMHPSVHSKTPGTCPICAMDLVPVTREEVKTGLIHVDAARRQQIGVETGRVERKSVTLRVRTVGRVTYDETRLFDVSLKVQGWIGEVHADYTGVRVAKGDPLFTIYAPELLSAQEELLGSLRRGGGRSPLLETAKRRLRLWNLTPAQIDSIARSGKPLEHVPILAPATGTVIEKNVVAGSAADAGTRLYRIADLSTVWIEAEAYEADLPLVGPGLPATITLSFLPGERFTGTVSYVYPYLDAATRTGRFRIEVPNEDGRIRPDMYASVEIEVPREEALVVAEDAVVMAGETNVVFVDLGEGRLRPQKIEIGRRTAEGFVVLDGLREGDVVVTSGNFLIAAESRLKSGVKKW